MTGRSVTLDPRTHAVRADIADIRLADQVFAPHYAVPMPQIVTVPVSLMAARQDGADVLAQLQPGETFEMLEIAGPKAWGIAVAHGLVGYVDRSALDSGVRS
ncbi:hypothetical protein ASE75_05675 [Sphingomonas sp. Leaf17]|nr:hypothetical protein ASE75_05675 [Sphingomonas sp. Leaf17]